MRYNDTLAEALRLRVSRAYNAPEAWYNSTTRKFIPGAFMIEKGSKTNGVGWKLAMVTNDGGCQTVIIHTTTWPELVDSIQLVCQANDLAQRVADAKAGR